MNRLFSVLAIVTAICRLNVALVVKSDVVVKSVQQDNSEEQLRLISPIDVNPDEFQNRGKLYKLSCPVVRLRTVPTGEPPVDPSPDPPVGSLPEDPSPEPPGNITTIRTRRISRRNTANEADYFTAFRSCMKDGQQLARDESLEDSKKLADIMSALDPGQQVWFGATDLGNPGSWIWLAALRPVGGINHYRNWKDGEPSSMGNCMAAEINSVGKIEWSAVDCSTVLCFVCEKTLT